MKTILTLCTVLFCGAALAGEPVSVLNHGQPTPSTSPAPAAPAASPAPAAPVASAPVATPAQACKSGQCQLRTYTAQEQAHDVTRRRLMGGYVIRKGSRTVLRPTR
jgi:hypothetical protein